MVRTAKRARERIIDAAASLLADCGQDAVSTRAVCAEAGVQAPAIYRHFGDMNGLLEAVVKHGFDAYLQAKADRPRAEDPVDDLREGWRMHVEFGLSNPALYVLMYGQPDRSAQSEAVQRADAILRGLVQRIAEAGRLRVGVDRAAHMMHAGAMGVTFGLLGMPVADRDLDISETTREAILAAITTDAAARAENGAARVVARAVALRAVLDDAPPRFSTAEKALLAEWLDRIAERRSESG